MRSALQGLRAQAQWRAVCYTFEGSFAGAMRHVLEAAARSVTPRCREVACMAAGAPECRFALTCEAA